MKTLVTAAQMRTIEELAIQTAGLSVATLMERAGEALARVTLDRLGPGGRIWVLCGSGNNGGDGLVAARTLAQAGHLVQVELVGRSLQGEPKRNFEALAHTAVKVGPIPEAEPRSGDAVIDALLGTGLNRPPSGDYASAIHRINGFRSRGATVVCADLPSGLHSDSGIAFEPCVKGDATVAFGRFKLGQVMEPGASLCGELKLDDLGLTDDLPLPNPGVFLLEEADLQALLPQRLPDTHKGTFGHLLVVAGGTGKSGAAALCAMAGLRSGAGRVSVATRADVLPAVLAHGAELMSHPLIGAGALGSSDLRGLAEAAEGKQAVVFGPGLDRSPETSGLLIDWLKQLTVPCVLDADGLNAVAGHAEALTHSLSPLLLTPHPTEMARLLGLSTAEVQADRLGAARALVARTGATVVLKGARTVIALPDGKAFVNSTGNPGMATAGTGDVLAGMCGALLAQGLSCADAARVGVFAHGLAGDLVAERTGQLGLIASDLLQGLQQVWTRWRR